MQRHPLAFGPFSFDDSTGTLWREGAQIGLGGRAASVLGALLAAGGSVVTRESLVQSVWGGAAVEDGNLAVQIAGLRKALGPRGDGQEWIATVPRVGYRLQRDLPPSTEGKPSLAILPFINMSDDPDQEHVADGIVEDLITAFSRFRNLGVIARQSSFVYKNRQFDIREAARALGVRYLVEGSVRRAGDRARVTAQLIDGTTGEHIWAEKLDGTMDDVFGFQDRVTSGIIGLIEPRIRQAEIERARRKPPHSLDAYDRYWRALPMLEAAPSEGYSEALDLLDRAVDLEPGFAPILALAAYGHHKRYSWGRSPAGVDDQAIGHKLVTRAMEADGHDPFVLLTAAIDLHDYARGDLDAVLTLARRAYELNPNSIVICNTTAWFEWMRGNYDAGIACRLRALAFSPGAPERFWSLDGLARTYLSAGQIEESLVWALRGIEANTQLVSTHAVAIACYALLGDLDEARRSLAALLGANPKTTLAGLLSECRAPHDRLLAEGLSFLETSTTLRTLNRA